MRKHFLGGIRGWASLMVVLAHVLRGIAKPAVPSYDKKFLLFVSDGTLAGYIFSSSRGSRYRPLTSKRVNQSYLQIQP